MALRAVGTYGGEAYRPQSWQTAATNPTIQTAWPSGSTVGGYQAPVNPAQYSAPIQTSLNMGQAPSQATPASGMGSTLASPMSWRAAATNQNVRREIPTMSYGAGAPVPGATMGARSFDMRSPRFSMLGQINY